MITEERDNLKFIPSKLTKFLKNVRVRVKMTKDTGMEIIKTNKSRHYTSASGFFWKTATYYKKNSIRKSV